VNGPLVNPKEVAVAKRGRSAVTGKFKDKKYVKKHPRTTVEETVDKPKKKKKK